MATRERFDLALARLDGTRWSAFEELASSFLAPDFPNLRTLSVPEGDAGRDATLFSAAAADVVALQYSVRQDWAAKVRETARRLRETFPHVKILVYVTNQVIGARADEIKYELQRDYSLFLDIRDRGWFLDRQSKSLQQEKAAERLSALIVDPLLSSEGVIETKGAALTTLESRAALVYLGLQWEDDTREKGLTKLSFEAVVKSVIRQTDPDHRMHRTHVLEGVRRVLPTHLPEIVDRYAESALVRMTKRAVRHYQQEDEFCLTFEERRRLAERLAEREIRDRDLTDEIRERLAAATSATNTIDTHVARVRRVAERYLMGRGEGFASNVAAGTIPVPSAVEVRDVVIKDYAEQPAAEPEIDVISAVVTELLDRPGAATQAYLRSIADSYTLLAFLRETPDVQSAVAKMFSYGEIWLDTSVVLPLFAELLADESARRFTAMIRAAVAAGMQLRITRGVLEEVERHINRSLACAATYSRVRWRGNVPFLYQMYALSGRSLDRFGSWLERFRGSARPEDDIAEYLLDNFKIEVGSLEKEAAAAPQDLRLMVHEIFASIHDVRRQRGATELDPMTLSRLAQHDAENYVGVIAKRREEDLSALGHRAWWLTLDRTAFGVQATLRDRIHGKVPDTPTLSPDFLVNYLALGPVRSAIPKNVESNLPLLAEGIGEFLPADILFKAEQIREESRDLPESVIRRRVRDGLDDARRRLGAIGKSGSRFMEESVTEAIRGSDGTPSAG
jgi:hypothetical protein